MSASPTPDPAEPWLVVVDPDVVGVEARLRLTGVATDCCVLSTALAAAVGGAHVEVVADACAGSAETNHRRAPDVMALYGPQITVTTTAEILP